LIENSSFAKQTNHTTLFATEGLCNGEFLVSLARILGSVQREQGAINCSKILEVSRPTVIEPDSAVSAFKASSATF